MKPSMLASFDGLREQNLMALKEAKENGAKVVGIYCTYGPRELVLAAGAIPVGLCGTRHPGLLCRGFRDTPDFTYRHAGWRGE
ncbi:Uncharacterized [Moorella glycerini]|uniref:Uncharacterized protein n=1 Tax=Neomoorella stamsii TaxID=1266720 RepID=A0A9X7P5C3_9FIRM|nr:MULTISPECIES: hypothetical protein [Moorella]PRR71399.1 hypothetical protein MOST_24520 [Moorella stamsii]CEP68608.1 Uncharacterized [Moorella glycerini]